MRFVYPAVIRSDNSGWHASFPDLPCCEADGVDLEDVLRNATLAAYDWVDLEMHEDEPMLPGASHEEDIELKDGEMIRHILVIYRILEGWEE